MVEQMSHSGASFTPDEIAACTNMDDERLRVSYRYYGDHASTTTNPNQGSKSKERRPR